MGSDKFAVKKMEVCEICGAFLIVGDAQSRIGTVWIMNRT